MTDVNVLDKRRRIAGRVPPAVRSCARRVRAAGARRATRRSCGARL